MGSSRGRGGLRAVIDQTTKKGQDRELTTQEQARRDWIRENRGEENINARASSPRMAGGLSGIVAAMSKGTLGNRRGRGGPRRSKATRDWIDQQRGVEPQPERKSPFGIALRDAPFTDVFGLKTNEERQRYQDRNAWIDEQIRKSKEKEEEDNSFNPLTQQQRRDAITEENFKLKDIWN